MPENGPLTRTLMDFVVPVYKLVPIKKNMYFKPIYSLVVFHQLTHQQKKRYNPPFLLVQEVSMFRGLSGPGPTPRTARSCDRGHPPPFVPGWKDPSLAGNRCNDFFSLKMSSSMMFPSAPCMEYLPTFARTKSPSFVDK